MGKNLIRFTSRPNLKYPLLATFYFSIRNIETMFLDKYFNFGDPLIFTILMFIGEFFAGLIVYLCQKKFVKKNLLDTDEKNKIRNILYKKAEKRIKIIDTKPKIIFILFCCGFFDFIQFFLSISAPKYINVSNSINSRLGGLLLIFDSIFYHFILKFPIMRHQTFCLILIGFFLFLIIITEFIFQEFNIFLSYEKFVIVFLYSFLELFNHAMIGVNEKYLYEFNKIDPFYSLLFEGLFGLLLSIIYSIFNNPLEKIIEFKKNKASSEFTIFTLCLIIYSVLSGLMNLYRVNVTKIFTQMTSSAVEYILNPIYFIINFSLAEDYLTKGKRNYAHFFINLIIGLLISFLGLAFNEFVILFFCDLDKDTHLQIAYRSKDESYFDLNEIVSIDDKDNDNDKETLKSLI